jgi:hypothetical protein
LAGIIFLGTPHLTFIDDDRWEKWRLLLKLNYKDVPKKILQPRDIQLLASVCDDFDGLNIQIPILSVYENIPTKIKNIGSISLFHTTEQVVRHF